jgi:hypothetical protein
MAVDIWTTNYNVNLDKLITNYLFLLQRPIQSRDTISILLLYLVQSKTKEKLNP